VIDLRTLRPLDTETVIESVKKTNRSSRWSRAGRLRHRLGDRRAGHGEGVRLSRRAADRCHRQGRADALRRQSRKARAADGRRRRRQSRRPQAVGERFRGSGGGPGFAQGSGCQRRLDRRCGASVPASGCLGGGGHADRPHHAHRQGRRHQGLGDHLRRGQGAGGAGARRQTQARGVPGRHDHDLQPRYVWHPGICGDYQSTPGVLTRGGCCGATADRSRWGARYRDDDVLHPVRRSPGGGRRRERSFSCRVPARPEDRVVERDGSAASASTGAASRPRRCCARPRSGT
jgi:hypothetical protein